MNQQISTISLEQYQVLWKKSNELISFNDQKNQLNEVLKDLVYHFLTYSNHFEFRSPFITVKPMKKVKSERIFGAKWTGSNT